MRQVCPAMVGPLGGGKYYCRGKEYGYCDRYGFYRWCAIEFAATHFHFQYKAIGNMLLQHGIPGHRLWPVYDHTFSGSQFVGGCSW
jgi:hypothetical protein